MKGAWGWSVHADAFDLFLEELSVAEGFDLDAVAIVVDGAGRIVEKFRDAGAFLDAQADESEDAQRGG